MLFPPTKMENQTSQAGKVRHCRAQCGILGYVPPPPGLKEERRSRSRSDRTQTNQLTNQSVFTGDTAVKRSDPAARLITAETV